MKFITIDCEERLALVIELIKEKFSFKKFNYDLPPVSEDAEFNNDLDFDSLGMLKLISLVEEKFKVEIEIEDAARLRTVKDLANLINVNKLADFMEEKAFQPV